MTAAPGPGRLVLLGHPVAHSLSPAFQNAALRHAGFSCTYELFDVPPEALSRALRLLRTQQAAGNVTIPHKVAVHAACDVLTPVAARVAAVNTFWFDPSGALVGDNTDVVGFDALASRLGVRRDGCVVACFGTGGAAAAVCGAVAAWPRASVRLIGRSPSRAAALAARFASMTTVSDSAAEALEGAHLVVNATPIGLHDTALPVDVPALPRDARVMDLVYRPGETAWVRAARAAGHLAADGREMLLEQGRAAFERWFGVEPNLEVMRRALNDAAKPSGPPEEPV